jgi:hypothetical protein
VAGDANIFFLRDRLADRRRARDQASDFVRRHEIRRGSRCGIRRRLGLIGATLEAARHILADHVHLEVHDSIRHIVAHVRGRPGMRDDAHLKR